MHHRRVQISEHEQHFGRVGNPGVRSLHGENSAFDSRAGHATSKKSFELIDLDRTPFVALWTLGFDRIRHPKWGQRSHPAFHAGPNR